MTNFELLSVIFLAFAACCCHGFLVPHRSWTVSHQYRPVSFESAASQACSSGLTPKNRLTVNNVPSNQRFRSPHTHVHALPDAVTELATSLFRNQGQVPLWQAFSLNAFLFALLRSKLLKSLTPEGYFHALALGTMLWNTLGWKGWTVCVLYLILGSAVTKVKFAEKEKLGIAEGRGGRRGPENVWGSAATGLMCAVASIQPSGSLLGIPSNLYLLGYVASLSTKLADTFASEIGKAYGKTTFLITTLERVEPGTEGAISAEGSAASVVGGALLSLYGWLVGLISGPAVPISIVAAFIATNIESLLGATLQGKDNFQWVTNEVINFLNTLIGAMIAIAAGMVLL